VFISTFSHIGHNLTSRNAECGAYYQAHVVRKDCNYLVALLKSFDHMAFDRTIDVENSIFEFFVPDAMVPMFLDLMKHMEDIGAVSGLVQKPNRLADPSEQL
jgi:hypothetical protein